ncbi:DUF6301 family protein [Nocardia camponoti]|uniref:Uncharacterized protein n=1 Tax=Nocardia camponoti TaxID=1616106 RepID=A0A917V9E0_9NOCA|nr:DUF6301 family protein [Nocardia camponoti]GGK52804.1 hypothetical protein GCM10011591_25690 [Nocardia camponoti]
MSRFDMDGATALVLAAARFDWTWRIYDLPRFCRVVGWELVNIGSEGAEMLAGLNVQHRSVVAYLKESTPRKLLWMSPVLAERGESGSPRLLSDYVSALRAIIEPQLGNPAMVTTKPSYSVTWQLPNVTLTIKSIHGVVLLRIINPAR